MPDELHVIFGAGQVGSPLAAFLMTAGKRVRVAKRTPLQVPAGADLMLGDAADAAFCVQAAAGATTLYNCMNPPYDAAVWARLWPLYTDNLIAAAESATARLIVLNNLYMLGNTHGAPMDETTPMRPASRKGQIRAQASERLFAAHRAGRVRAAEGRAADYYGPGGRLTYIGDYFWKPALAGRRVYLPIDPDALHTYHYIPDVAAGLAALGNADDDSLGRAWILPCQPAENLRTLVERMSGVLGHPIALAKIPQWFVKAGALVVPFVREIEEMAYQWKEPFIASDRLFRERFGVLPTDRGDAALATVAWAKATYA